MGRKPTEEHAALEQNEKYDVCDGTSYKVVFE